MMPHASFQYFDLLLTPAGRLAAEFHLQGPAKADLRSFTSPSPLLHFSSDLSLLRLLLTYTSNFGATQN